MNVLPVIRTYTPFPITGDGDMLHGFVRQLYKLLCLEIIDCAISKIPFPLCTRPLDRLNSNVFPVPDIKIRYRWLFTALLVTIFLLFVLLLLLLLFVRLFMFWIWLLLFDPKKDFCGVTIPLKPAFFTDDHILGKITVFG